METLVVRELTDEDALSLLEMNIDNKEYFEKWAPIKPTNSYYSLEGQLQSIKSANKKIENDESYSYGIFLEKNNTPIGYLSFAFVQRDPLQSAMIGYNISEKYIGKGYATKAVLLSLKIAFKTLHFHRISAGVDPENIGSLRVLEKSGFVREGYSPKVLKVNKQWRDIINMAVLEENM